MKFHAATTTILAAVSVAVLPAIASGPGTETTDRETVKERAQSQISELRKTLEETEMDERTSSAWEAVKRNWQALNEAAADQWEKASKALQESLDELEAALGASDSG
jgi:molecular chaperone GrpE (heat shock protein)